MKVIEQEVVGKHRLVKIVAESGEEAFALVDRWSSLQLQDQQGIVESLRGLALRFRREAGEGKRWKRTKDALNNLAMEYMDMAGKLKRENQ